MLKKMRKNIVEILLEKGKNSYDIAKLLNHGLRTIERDKQELIGEGKLKSDKATTEIKEFNSSKYTKEAYNASTKMINSLREELAKSEPYELIKISKKKQGDTLIIHITDWHVGRIVKDERGNIIYDEKIFREKIDKFCYELLKLLDKYITKGTPISEVKIISTGDILDGSGIFASQEAVSELSPPFQVMVAIEVIQKLILSLLKRKLPVEFFGVKGNHGEIRVNGKSRDPNANWDLMLYLLLDFWAKNIVKKKNLKINYSELDYFNFEIRGWKYHARHKAPQQSETAAGKAKFLGWARQHGFDVLVYGHYHHWGVFDRSRITIFRGGALTAGDEFAETLAEESDPIQLLWGTTEHRPATFIYPIDLGKKEKRGEV